MKTAYAIVWTALFSVAAAAAISGRAQAAPAPAELTRAVDVVVGRDKTGPYPLAWKNVRSENVGVLVDGATLAAADYTLDAAAGTVTFRTPLKANSIARVEYGYEPNKAQRNAAGFTLQPVTVSLLNTSGVRGSLGLQVTALPGTTNNPLLVLGLSGKTGLLGGGLTSELLLSPDTQGGGMADRAGVRLGYALGTDRNKIDFSFARAGEGFAPGAGKSFGLAEPSERWTLAGQAAPAAWLSGEFKLLGTRDLAGKGASEGSRLALRLFGANGAPALSLARTEDNQQAAGAATGVTTETADLAGKSGATTFRLQGQRVATDATDDRKDETKENVALSVATVSGDKKTQASVALGMNSVENAAGAEQRQSVDLSAKTAPGAATLSLSAQGQRVATDAAAGGDQTRENAALAVTAATKTAQATVSVSGGTVETAKGVDAADKIEATARVQAAAGLSVAAEVRRTDNSSRPAEDGKEASSTETTASKVNVAAQIGGAALVVQGQRVVTDGTAAEADKTQQDASLALSAASKNKKAAATVSLTGGTVETEKGIEARQGVEVKLQPAPMLTLSAESRLQTVTPAESGTGAAAAGQQSVVQTARAELRPVRDTVLSGALRVQGNQDKRASVTDLNAQTQLGGRLVALSGGWTDREDSGPATALLDTTRLRMTLRPVAGISVTGGLTLNPEEKDGRVTEATRQEYGLAARVGALDLSGGYALTTFTGAAILPVGLGPQSGELSLNLGLRFSRYTRLTGGYKDAFLWGGPESRGERAVSLGFTHDVGSAFNLSLGGTRTEDKAEVGKPADLKADLKMGLKF